MLDQEQRPKLWLYPNKYATTPKHPGKTGNGEISKAALREFVDTLKTSPGDTVKLKCAAWERTSKKGNPYTFITIELDEGPKTPPAEDDNIPF